jgi:hypothetical protein
MPANLLVAGKARAYAGKIIVEFNTFEITGSRMPLIVWPSLRAR